MTMMRTAGIIAVICGAALLGGCYEHPGAGVGFGVSGSYPSLFAEARIPDTGSREHWVVLESRYYQDVRICYRRYLEPVGNLHWFWEAGVSTGTVHADYGGTDEGEEATHLTFGAGTRWWWTREREHPENRPPDFLDVSIDLMPSLEVAQLSVGLGWSFHGPGYYRPAPPAEPPSPPEPPGEEPPAGRGRGALGMRAGMLLPASGESAGFGQSMLVGLSYRLPGLYVVEPVHELTVDFGWPEEIAGYESRPVIGGLNLLVPLGSITEKVKGRLVLGLGVMFESVKKLGTRADYTNYTAILNVGAGAVFAGGYIDTRLTYSVFAGTENLIGRACFTVTHSF